MHRRDRIVLWEMRYGGAEGPPRFGGLAAFKLSIVCTAAATDQSTSEENFIDENKGSGARDKSVRQQQSHCSDSLKQQHRTMVAWPTKFESAQRRVQAFMGRRPPTSSPILSSTADIRIVRLPIRIPDRPFHPDCCGSWRKCPGIIHGGPERWGCVKVIARVKTTSRNFRGTDKGTTCGVQQR